MVSSVVLYFLIWWTVIFMTLPFGNKRAENVTVGHAPSAPAVHNMKRKVIVTTIVSFFLWLFINPAVHHFLDNVRNDAHQMAIEDEKKD